MSVEKRTSGVRRGARLTECRPAFHARKARSTARDKHQNDVVARSQIDNTGSAFDHFRGCLVAERDWHGTRSIAVDDRQIGVTKAGGFDSDEHFTRTRPG
ncbi:hypothetical protein CS8_027850 [Cupriavidus sp. 8B]